jgi:hypothetical protein
LSGEGIQIILDIFSGRPNPFWMLTEDQVNELKEMFSNLSSTEAIQPPILGYRGFIIQNLAVDPIIPNEVTVYKNVLIIDQHGDISFKNDDNHIEDWLLKQADERGFTDIIKTFDVGGQEPEPEPEPP